jgi:SAM-dependent methyltransferase
VLTRFETLYLALEPFLLPLHRRVRRELRAQIGQSCSTLRLLDAGGRKSNITVAIPAVVTISELNRETDVQNRLHLGVNKAIVRQILARRSNVREVIFDDMTRSNIDDSSFDIVVSVEVLEHVDEDDRFVRQVARVLKPGGFFLMTTPNGDYVPNTSNPDHRRHYTKKSLQELLANHFDAVEVWYAIPDSWWRDRGLVSWSARHPVATAASMLGNLILNMKPEHPEIRNQAKGTNHLFAFGKAPQSSSKPVGRSH